MASFNHHIENILCRIAQPERISIAEDAEMAGATGLAKVAEHRLQHYGSVQFGKYATAKLWAQWSRALLSRLGPVEISKLWISIQQRGVSATASITRHTTAEVLCVFRYAKRVLKERWFDDLDLKARLEREDEALAVLEQPLGLVTLHGELDREAELQGTERPWGGYRYPGEYSEFELRGPSCPHPLADSLRTVRNMKLIPGIGLKALEIEDRTRWNRVRRQRRAVERRQTAEMEIRNAIKAGPPLRAEYLKRALAAQRRAASGGAKHRFAYYQESLDDFNQLPESERERLVFGSQKPFAVAA